MHDQAFPDHVPEDVAVGPNNHARRAFHSERAAGGAVWIVENPALDGMLFEPGQKSGFFLAGDPGKLHGLVCELVDHGVPARNGLEIVGGVGKETQNGEFAVEVHGAPSGEAALGAQNFCVPEIGNRIAGFDVD